MAIERYLHELRLPVFILDSQALSFA